MRELVFEWDVQKARTNREKHGVSFEEAVLAFGDDDASYKRDELHSDDEDRFIIVCMSPRNAKDRTMERKNDPDDDPLDREIDFSDAKPNKFAREFYKFQNVRILAPDLLAAFPDSESMNEALRTLVSIAERTQKPVREKISARRVSAAKPRRKVRS